MKHGSINLHYILGYVTLTLFMCLLGLLLGEDLFSCIIEGGSLYFYQNCL